MSAERRVAFVFIGGVHHVFHTMPVACALSRRENVEVIAFVADEPTEWTAATVKQDMGGNVTIRRMRRPKLVDRLFGAHRAKLPLLWRNRRELGSFDAIVVPERTSLILRRMGVTRPAFINLPHGAGDRAISVDPRYNLFDRILLAGPKTAARMISTGIRASSIRQVGYPKAEFLADIAGGKSPLFENGRPVVFFNPHFRRHLSSLDAAMQIVEAITAETDYNLIVAPHIRSFEGASEDELRRWHALAVPGRVIVDTGSPRLIDMSYVAAADLYLGDVSSQVYEFLLLGLRPCVFVNAHGVKWADDLSYRHWHLGSVVTPAGVVQGLRTALSERDAYAERQQAAVAETFARLKGSSESAADAILECIAERQ
ncbi:hypothetical protein V6R86_10015 [Sphingomonas kaistensis]|uniref:Uncharacterized protein n=1 Tax=Sphingomonas kaistensis TaxID=298708 RepID=A0ABZ2G255_9SPHN